MALLPNGIRVIVNDSSHGMYVKKTWKERLLSWPWKPWESQRYDKYAGCKVVEDGEIMLCDSSIAGETTIVINSNTWNSMKEKFPEHRPSMFLNF